MLRNRKINQQALLKKGGSNSPWINEDQAVRQGAAEFEKRSILGIYEQFRSGRNAAWRP
jgi:hypothetical protein